MHKPNDVDPGSAPTLGSLCLVRLPVWLIATCVGAWFIGAGAVRCSREIVERGWDLSALAWSGFLPFMIPFWLYEAGCVVVPIALIYEVSAWALFRKD